MTSGSLKTQKTKKTQGNKKNAIPRKSFPCPLCRFPLNSNENISSQWIEKGGDSFAHIFGCPYCYKNHPKKQSVPPYFKVTRKCPVCLVTLDDKNYLIARRFARKSSKPDHIHVLGCSVCRKEAVALTQKKF